MISKNKNARLFWKSERHFLYHQKYKPPFAANGNGLRTRAKLLFQRIFISPCKLKGDNFCPPFSSSHQIRKLSAQPRIKALSFVIAFTFLLILPL
jgi:hypothetical protein